MKFTKMNGLGNDYLYIYTNEVPENVKELAIKYSDRHFGVGSDGLIYILPSDVADFKMRIFNADGSEANMCGNGIRCVGKYVYDRGYTDKTEIQIDTLSGVKTLHLTLDGERDNNNSSNSSNRVSLVSVDMGQAHVDDELEVEINCGLVYNKTDQTLTSISVANQVDNQTKQQHSRNKFVPTIPVDMGNPHAVTFVADADAVPLEQVGPALEKNTAFPGGVNAEFIHVISPTEIRMRVWERGSGITWACGTGSCASVAAAISRGLCARNKDITVHLDGGDLIINIDDKNNVTMTGPATFVCDGETL